VNLRKYAYFSLFALRGQAVGANYKRILREDLEGIPPDTTKKLLTQLLTHCKESVPYYAGVMKDLGDSFREDPEEYLRCFPILTREMLRARFDEFKSKDLGQRNWYLNSTSGSTGEPVQFIQDRDFATRAGAITFLFSKLAGREVGECEARIWGSERDIIHGSERWKALVINIITNTIFLNAYRMTPECMRDFIAILNRKMPKLIIAYAEAIFELAKFSERESLELIPQNAVITSASTLYPFMRDTIEKVFGCKVFNRYGSREVGDIACERPGREGLWVAPWGNYVEVVDPGGNRLPDGKAGEILVTCLNNFAMPLIRYRIEDYGVLSPPNSSMPPGNGQVLETVIGRIGDTFVDRNGNLIHGCYFRSLLSFENWISKFQVIQKSPSLILIRIVKADSYFLLTDLEEISRKSKILMGQDCEIAFEFVDDISSAGSDKFRYVISEMAKQ
jgi:phenylacetate-CoA ligase